MPSDDSSLNAADKTTPAGPRRGETLELTIESLAFGGRGIARVDENFVIFVEGALPGDRVRARVDKRKPQYAEATTVARLADGPGRRVAPCPLAAERTCGGCKMQDLDEAHQLKAKHQQVMDAFRHIALMPTDATTAEADARPGAAIIRPILPSPDPWHYRNKMEFSFGRPYLPREEFLRLRAEADAALEVLGEAPRRSGAPRDAEVAPAPMDAEVARAALLNNPLFGIEIGLHRPGDFRRITDVAQCLIHPREFDTALAWMRQRLQAEARAAGPWLRPYDNRAHTGFLRHLVLRHSVATGRFVVALLTAPPPRGTSWDAAGRALAEDFLRDHPACQGFLWGTNTALSDVARCDEVRVEAGDTTLRERLDDLEFAISPFSFFQTNTRGATQLYAVAREFAQLTGREHVLDVYCGTGTIGMTMARAAQRVVGVELVESAVADARANAAANGLSNCEFHAGDAAKVLARLAAEGARFDVVVLDPPRAGLDAAALDLAAGVGAPRIVYVSCNPTTQARDAARLAEHGYRLVQMQPVDMFPHTFHIENVALFTKGTE